MISSYQNKRSTVLGNVAKINDFYENFEPYTFFQKALGIKTFDTTTCLEIAMRWSLHRVDES
jgi:hypothetical protein